MVFALAAGTFVSAAASVAIESLDNIYVNGAQMFNGGADAWLAANEIKGKIQTIGVRGWIIMGDSQVPSTFGYRIDNGEPVKVADSVVYDQGIVDATGFSNIRRDVLTADVTKVGLGEHTFTIAAWNDADEVAYGKSFKFTQELAPDEEPEPLPPAIVGNALDAWQYWQNSALVAPAAVFTQGTIQGFHIAGWFGYNYPALAVGYRINGVETFVDGVINFNPEQGVKDAGGANAVRYSMDGSFSSLILGSNDFDIIVKLDDPKQSVVDLFPNIPAQVIPAADEAVWFYDPAANYLGSGAPYSTGYWIGPAAEVANGDISITFTTPESFNGVFGFKYSAATGAQVNVILRDEAGNDLEAIKRVYAGDAYSSTLFSRSYPAGTYTIDYVFNDDTGGYFVLGSGTPTENVATIGGVCNKQYPEAAPAIALIKADFTAECQNAAWDDLKYDETVLCSAKAYKWVVDNADALNYEEGAVSGIYFRGWAQLNCGITAFGYSIDGGALVTSTDFIEAGRAGLPDGAQGYALTVPVADLKAGNHTIKIVAIAVDGTAVDIIKTKDSVDYPVALNFTISEPAPVAEMIKFNSDVFQINNGVLTVQGWAGANMPANNLGYRIDDGENILDGVEFANFNTPAEGETIKSLAGENAFRFKSRSGGIELNLEPGEHTITLLVRVTDGTNTYILDMGSKTFTISERPDPAVLVNMSFNTVWVDGTQVCDVGDALAFLKDSPISGEISTIGLRGWAYIANSTIDSFGYRIDDGEPVCSASYTQDRADVYNNAFHVTADVANGFNIQNIDVSDLDAGAHTVTVVVKAADDTYVDVVAVPFSVVGPDANTIFFADLATPGVVSGWWTGPAIGLPLGATVDFTFTTDNAFDGLAVQLYANDATFNVNLLNENGIKIDTIESYLAVDAVPTYYFKKAYAPGTYTIQFEFVSGNYLVVSTGTASAYPVTVKANGFISNGDTLPGFVAFLTGAINPGAPEPAKCINAAFDVLKYDEKELCSSKAYKWVADEANRAALNFTKADVENIFMRGWAQLDKAILGFGYRIDGGAIVMDPAFVENRADLGDYAGAQGYTVTVPVGTLSSGEHTVEVVAIDEDGLAVPVIKVKDGVTYPVAVTFTVNKIEDHESVITNKSFDKYIVDGVDISTWADINYAGNIDRNILAKYPQVYALNAYSPFTREPVNTITITGWASFDGEYVETFGYKIDDQPSVTSPDFIVNRNAELAGAGFAYGQGFSITFDYSDLTPGEHTVTLFATALDEVENELLTYTFTVAEVGTWLFDIEGGANIGDGMGWWTGYNVDPNYVNGDVSITFTTPDAFDGVYTIYWANNIPGAVMKVNLYDENDELLETVDYAFMFNACQALKFKNVYEPGTYTLQYLFDEEQQAHFVLGAGAHNEIETAVFGACNNSGSDTYAPAIGLLAAPKTDPEKAECQNAAWDELKYDDETLVAEKAYKWVVDNKDALNYTLGDVSAMYFKGWAQLNKAIKGFGYVVDNGDVVTGEFILDRAAELEQAGFPGAQGFAITVPVDALKAGEHTIKIVAISENDEVVEIFKTKEGVDYPVAVTFTVTEKAGEFKLGDVNKDGSIDNKDVVVLFRELSKTNPDLDPAVADVNGDGFIDNKDVVVLFRQLSEI